MAYELNEIKHIRKKFGLTQADLAKRSDVSQSLIAKIEAGRIDPTFSKVEKIFEALDKLQEKHELKADALMNKKIITLDPKDNVIVAIKKMRKYDISQMPVVSGEKAVGLVSEATILKKMSEVEDPALLSGLTVKDVMDECPPIVTPNANSKVISYLLTFYPVVLISDNGKLLGLITKSDFINKMYRELH